MAGGGPWLLEPLTAEHDATGFASGQPALDGWLRDSALTAQLRGLARTYLWHESNAVVAYSALLMATVERKEVPAKAGRRKPDRIPAVLVGKLAVDRSLQGRGLGADVLFQTLAIAPDASRLVAAGFVVVDAISDDALRFYERFGFENAPNTSRAVMAMKRVYATLAAPDS